eukprot:30908-Pelagococcus_subviridis.AAC.5
MTAPSRHFAAVSLVPNASTHGVPPAPPASVHTISAAAATSSPSCVNIEGHVSTTAATPSSFSSHPVALLRVVPYKATAGWSSKASVGVVRRRGRGL